MSEVRARRYSGIIIFPFDGVISMGGMMEMLGASSGLWCYVFGEGPPVSRIRMGGMRDCTDIRNKSQGCGCGARIEDENMDVRMFEALLKAPSTPHRDKFGASIFFIVSFS